LIEMGIAKIQILGNDYVGAWSVATDKFFLLGSEVNKKTAGVISGTLGVEIVRSLVGGSSLLGIYACGNSRGVLVPNLIESYELKDLRQSLPGVAVEILQTDLNALKNNILANDRIAIINPNFGAEEERAIRDVLDVETGRERRLCAGKHPAAVARRGAIRVAFAARDDARERRLFGRGKPTFDIFTAELEMP